MADMMSILAANYKTVGTTIPTKTPYVAVDPALYEGSWTGKYPDHKTFKITISNVMGFRAKVQYQSGGTNKFQEVLIKDNSFRIGDTKLTLTDLAKRRSRTSSPIRRAARPISIRPLQLPGGGRNRARANVSRYAVLRPSALRSVARRRWARPWSGRAHGNRRGGAARLPRETA